jgi:antitoxin component of RelBE/YafQ-DinJ toxin-antitoxin module
MTTLQVRISEDFKMSAQNLSKSFGVSLSDLVRMAMADFVEKRRKQSVSDGFQKRELLKKLSQGNRDRSFHKLSDESIDRLVNAGL